ncbi:TetR/AcrR family transcriptional regulator [Sphingorhabdus sp. EL138]|uniref:TetR/AcrR family transcriptional regulator n=1 Tax=Sphingorhabdus sp. EL138 TaxID=2073156 RepID=UPI000D68A0C2|nr:TetR/AcrR family transcriptional regulator [Sphingorhabdus sp. EL138]
MKKRSATASRILDVSRRAFNAKGYAATSVTEIAASLHMSQGNLTYHFPAKRDLAKALEDDVLSLMKDHRAAKKNGTLADDYIDHLLFGMELTWRYRFLLRDRMHYAGEPVGQRPDSELTADYEGLVALLKRIDNEGLFVGDNAQNIDVLGRSLWIVSRYWVDYLRELEGLEQVSWADQERGIEHHLAVLFPYLKASARREFKAALDKQQI